MQFEIKSQYFIVFKNKVTNIREYDGSLNMGGGG